jgi:hypothetical protein
MIAGRVALQASGEYLEEAVHVGPRVVDVRADPHRMSMRK